MPISPGTGWFPDPPDPRDYVPDTEKIEKVLKVHKPLQKAVREAAAPPLPSSVDLAPFFPPVVNQGALNSCTACTATALLGYFENRAFGRAVLPSLMFLYKIERNLLSQTGDTGAFLRTAMQALRTFGVPPDQYWPNNPALLDVEPSPFLYAYADNYKATSYYRLDETGMAGDALLSRVKSHLAMSLPSMFGFYLFSSSSQASQNGGRIPFPLPGDVQTQQHALVAVGYDDHEPVLNYNPMTGQYATTIGALKIRNSWGPTWGIGGYGWLPYDYVLRGLTRDWWVLIKADYLDTNQFGPNTAPERLRPSE